LGDGLDQFELARASQNEPAHSPVGIDDSLEVREQLGNALNFIEDRSIDDLPQKSSRIVTGEGAGVRVFQ
jgi:hypothetical protein